MTASDPPGLNLYAAGCANAETLTGNVAIMVAGEPIAITVTVPVARVGLDALLPIFHGFLQAMTDKAAVRSSQAGAAISCRAGCGACCRQAVPIAASEARALAAHVAAMPAPRRDAIVARFAEARQRLAAAGFGAVDFTETTPEQRFALAHAYFRIGVACPFLEDENCSIHPVRPLSCREYLVTSPASACATLETGAITMLDLGGSLSEALIAGDMWMTGGHQLLLVEALDWVDANRQAPPLDNGAAMAQTVFGIFARLTGG